MARRRTRVEAASDVMPREVLEHADRGVRRAWFEARQLFTWRDQHDAIQKARETYGIVKLDTREILGHISNDNTYRQLRRSSKR